MILMEKPAIVHGTRKKMPMRSLFKNPILDLYPP